MAYIPPHVPVVARRDRGSARRAAEADAARSNLDHHEHNQIETISRGFDHFYQISVGKMRVEGIHAKHAAPLAKVEVLESASYISVGRDLLLGATESSRSIQITSAAREAAFSIISGLVAGTNSMLRSIIFPSPRNQFPPKLREYAHRAPAPPPCEERHVRDCAEG